MAVAPQSEKHNEHLQRGRQLVPGVSQLVSFQKQGVAWKSTQRVGRVMTAWSWGVDGME